MLDLYCERLGPGLWEEPLNVITNLAFLIAAWGGWRLASRRRALSIELWLLIAVSMGVGIGSGLFHILATEWAHTLDLVFIFAFQLAFLWTYFRRVGGMQPALAAGLVFAFLGIALWARGFPHILSGSVSYVPALIALLVLGVYHAATRRAEPLLLLASSAVFFVSLIFRSIDRTVCPYIPVGTHFIWHLLNALLLFLLMKALIANVQPRAQHGERLT